MKKILLGIGVILVVVLCIIIFRNYNIINKIIMASNEYSKLTTYSYEIHNIKPNEDVSKIYVQDNTTLLVKEEKSILYDEDTNTTITKDLTNNTTEKDERRGYVNKIPLLFQGEYNFFEKLALSFNVKFGYKQIDGKNCYVLKKGKEITYIYKDTYFIAKNINDSSEIEYLNWVKNPDLTEIIKQYSN